MKIAEYNKSKAFVYKKTANLRFLETCSNNSKDRSNEIIEGENKTIDRSNETIYFLTPTKFA